VAGRHDFTPAMRPQPAASDRRAHDRWGGCGDDAVPQLVVFVRAGLTTWKSRVTPIDFATALELPLECDRQLLVAAATKLVAEHRDEILELRRRRIDRAFWVKSGCDSTASRTGEPKRPKATCVRSANLRHVVCGSVTLALILKGLITQRSLVQIQPRNQQEQGVSGTSLSSTQRKWIYWRYACPFSKPGWTGRSIAFG
jgi:hypothetical protein